jgi:hypothetical protein
MQHPTIAHPDCPIVFARDGRTEATYISSTLSITGDIAAAELSPVISTETVDGVSAQVTHKFARVKKKGQPA